ncbi:Probable sodium/metabolite cotransporter BASS6, chloroplastic [Linum perenne]
MTLSARCFQPQTLHIPPSFRQQYTTHFPKCSNQLFPASPHTSLVKFPVGSSRFLVTKCVSDEFSGSFEPDSGNGDQSQTVDKNNGSLVDILKQANSLLPHVVLASTLVALVYPPSFTWFTTRYYAPALGFLMFAVGLNSNEKDFVEAFRRPTAILAGYIGQFVVKPILGYLFGVLSVSMFGLPTAIGELIYMASPDLKAQCCIFSTVCSFVAGAGIMLVSCVSGAQLSNYATFLTDPSLAPLSIVMTSLSTATAVFVTPLLSLLLIGKRLPVDVKGMVSSITQIVVAPIAAGLFLNRFFPRISSAIRPFLPPLSVIVTACCVGAPLAINVESVMSPFGVTILSLIIAFHLSAFVIGYSCTGFAFHDSPDLKPLQRTISYETGMQSSLLALALANKFFKDPLVAVPPAISTVIMSLMGFSLVMIWGKKKEQL